MLKSDCEQLLQSQALKEAVSTLRLTFQYKCPEIYDNKVTFTNLTDVQRVSLARELQDEDKHKGFFQAKCVQIDYVEESTLIARFSTLKYDARDMLLELSRVFPESQIVLQYVGLNGERRCTADYDIGAVCFRNGDYREASTQISELHYNQVEAVTGNTSDWWDVDDMSPFYEG